MARFRGGPCRAPPGIRGCSRLADERRLRLADAADLGPGGGEASPSIAPRDLSRTGPRRVDPGPVRRTIARRVHRCSRSAQAIALPRRNPARLRGRARTDQGEHARRGEVGMNRVLAHTGAKVPIMQAPMGWIARSQLASAMSNAGGLGVIETSSGEVDACMAEIARMRELTDKPFGVNLPLLFIRDPRVVDRVAQSGVKFVSTSAGSPAKLLPTLKAAGLTVYHVVPNLSTALKAVDAGVDGLIVEGGEGGGFKNPDDVSTLVLLQAVRERTDVPLIAAGGICDGRGMAAAFALGAEGIQMGTRFVSAAESPVHDNYKQAIIDADDTGTVMLNRKASPCVRALKTGRAREIDRQGGFDRTIFGSVKDVYFGGDMEASLALAGQTVGLIHEVLPVAENIQRTVEGFHRIRREQWARSARGEF